MFYSRLVGEGRVRKLLKLDLIDSLNTIYRTSLLRKLESLVRDRYVLELIESFLAIRILDNEGKDWSTGLGYHLLGLSQRSY